jgi:DNA modification methylase
VRASDDTALAIAGSQGHPRRLRLIRGGRSDGRSASVATFRDVEPGELYCDDCLVRVAQLPDESIDLVYLDPPFFRSGSYEVVWGDEAEVRSFKYLLQGGINHYVGWLRERLTGLHRVLKPTGSLYLHCDPSASHYIKVALDEIFGVAQFRNEIIWKRTSSHSSAKRFGPVHDVILFYSKSPKMLWNGVTVPHDPDYIELFFDNIEQETGRRYHRNVLTGPGLVREGDSGKPWRGYDPSAHGRHWALPVRMVAKLGIEGLSAQEKLDALDAAGRIHWPKKAGGSPRLKYYEDEMQGQPANDVWSDIRPISGRSDEKVGFPTQKPEELLERIITASTERGQVVLDPFCGCGTTIAVAHRLRRRWIGIDSSLTAVEVIKRRMERREGVYGIEISGLPESEADLRELEPLEFQNWVIRRIHGNHAKRKTGDMGIDGYSFFEQLPVQVKQTGRVGRNVVDNFETAIRRDGKHKGYIIAFGFTRGAHEEAARATKEGLEVALVEISTLLEDPQVAPREPASQMLQDLRRGILVAQQSATVPETPRVSVEEIAAIGEGVY